MEYNWIRTTIAHSEDEKYMLRAFFLAINGIGTAFPNPMVGCVIVKNGEIIGEGYHSKYGEAHAEVNAINSVTDKSLIKGSTIYVTLEPCSHTGKTPPCVNLVLLHQPQKVVIANLDPNPLVNGRGIELMKIAGIEVISGVLENLGLQINRRFFTSIKEKRPYIILKWAQTKNGMIARSDFDSKWISGAVSRKLVHKWRSEEQGIMTAFRTTLYDNPSLTVRDWIGKNPVRIIIDPKAALPTHLNVFSDNKVHTLVFTTSKSGFLNSFVEYIQLNEETFIESLFSILYERKIATVLIEGGSSWLQMLIKTGYWDEIRLFRNPFLVFDNGIKAPSINQFPSYTECIEKDELHWYFKNEIV